MNNFNLIYRTGPSLFDQIFSVGQKIGFFIGFSIIFDSDYNGHWSELSFHAQSATSGVEEREKSETDF